MTPCFMICGAEASLPADLIFEAPRVVAYTEGKPCEALEDSVDLLDEVSNVALARTVVYQQALRNYHSRRVCSRRFAKGDLVLKLKQKRHHKLASPWEGPYIVTEVIPGGAYRIKHVASGKMESNPWNVAHLRQFHV